MTSMRRHVRFLGPTLACFALTSLALRIEAKEAVPDGFVQIIPRGRIAAIDSPRFVPAAEAEIPPDAWVLGLVFDGEARAYSLNLLNQHEVVNDRISGRPIAAVW